LYVADLGGNYIRQINAYTGRVTTLSGTASTTNFLSGVGTVASHRSVFDIAVLGVESSTGIARVLVSERENHVIRHLRITPASNITCVGGTYCNNVGQFVCPIGTF
jgi:hypothetical protein